MSNVNDILSDIDNNVAYYNPNDDTSGKKYATIEEGTYEATVSKLNVKRDIVIKNEYLSDIFEATYTIDDDKYPDLKGREVKSKGYFRFKTPDKAKYLYMLIMYILNTMRFELEKEGLHGISFRATDLSRLNEFLPSHMFSRFITMSVETLPTIFKSEAPILKDIILRLRTE